jgi:hypothetical protein
VSIDVQIAHSTRKLSSTQSNHQHLLADVSAQQQKLDLRRKELEGVRKMAEKRWKSVMQDKVVLPEETLKEYRRL